MASFKGGDKKAFETLFTRHQNGVFRFLHRFLGSVESAEEAFQEVFLRVIRSTETYVPTAKFTTWLYTIVRNYCFDQGRRAKIRQVSSLDDTTEGEGDWHEKIADGTAGPDVRVGARDLEVKLEAALERINPDQREVFLLREKSELPFEEISAIVGAPVNTVKSRMRYALLALQGELKKLGIRELK